MFLSFPLANTALLYWPVGIVSFKYNYQLNSLYLSAHDITSIKETRTVSPSSHSTLPLPVVGINAKTIRNLAHYITCHRKSLKFVAFDHRTCLSISIISHCLLLLILNVQCCCAYCKIHYIVLFYTCCDIVIVCDYGCIQVFVWILSWVFFSQTWPGCCCKLEQFKPMA